MRGLELEDAVNFKPIVKATKGFSGADMSNLCREAAIMPLRRMSSLPTYCIITLGR